MQISKLTLGTAQLGLEYGIANKSGKPEFSSALELLEYSWRHGINSFDTAPAYGNSEEIIGAFIETIVNSTGDVVIVSKLPGIPDIESLSMEELYDRVKTSVLNSLRALRLQSLPVYLLHRPSELFSSENGFLLDCLERIKDEGLVEKIGVSIYEPNEAELALTYKELKTIQIPINVFDHRLIDSGILDKLKNRGFLVFARSVFLQGLCLLQPDSIPEYLNEAKPMVMQLHDIAMKYNMDLDAMCFLFARDLPGITSVVVGSETIEQIKRNISILKLPRIKSPLTREIIETFQSVPEYIINPSKWNK
jgi:aryl-alcohol dehydrogenase-like predicted oxidoreductase